MTRLFLLTTALSAALPLTAVAQDADAPACPAGEWIAGDAAASDVSTAENPLVGDLPIPDRGHTILAFRVTSDQQAVRIEGSSDLDTAFELSTPEGDVILENDDGPTSLNPVGTPTLGPGEYCLKMSIVGGGAGAALAQVSRPDQPPLLSEEQASGEATPLPPCDFAQAQALTDKPMAVALDGGPITRTLPGNGTSFVRFHLDDPQSLILTARSDTLDPQLALDDSHLHRIGENDDDEGMNARIDLVDPLPAGDYCLVTNALSGGEGEIMLGIERLDRDKVMAGLWARGEAVSPQGGPVPMEAIDLRQTRQMAVLHDGRAKWFTLEMAQPSILIVDAMGALMGVDPKLVLFGPAGQQVADNDDNGESTDARLGPVLLEPGHYSLALIDVNRNETGAGPVRSVALMLDLFQRVR